MVFVKNDTVGLQEQQSDTISVNWYSWMGCFQTYRKVRIADSVEVVMAIATARNSYLVLRMITHHNDCSDVHFP